MFVHEGSAAAGRPQVRAGATALRLHGRLDPLRRPPRRVERWAARPRRARSSKTGERDAHPRTSAGGSGSVSGATGDAVLSAYQVGLGRIAVSDIELPYLGRTGITWLNGGATRQYDRTLLPGEGAAGDRQRERRMVQAGVRDEPAHPAAALAQPPAAGPPGPPYPAAVAAGA